MIPSALLVMGILAAVPADGPPPVAKPAWQWSVEERIALRTNPVAARERAGRNHKAASQAADANAAMVVDAFNGRTHPELFLPHEVFRNLMRMVFLSSPEVRQDFRGAMQDDVERLAMPPEFWPRLEAICAEHVSDMREHIALSTAWRSAKDDVRTARLQSCRSGAAALAAARREFGPELFDRFLYEAVASGMFQVSDELPDAQQLRQQGSGCR